METSKSTELITDLIVPDEIIGNINEMIEDDGVSTPEILQEIVKIKMKSEREQFIKDLSSKRDINVTAIREDLRFMYKSSLSEVEPCFPDYLETDIGLVYLNTFDNMKALLEDKLEIDFFYDVIKKEVVITKWGDIDQTAWNNLNNKYTKLISHIMSEAVKATLQKTIIPDHLDSVLFSHEKNPLLKGIKKGKWDGKDHIKKMVKRIKSNSGDFKYRKDGITKWLIQCVAAWDGAMNTPRKDALPKYEFILVYGGYQGAKKTSHWHSLMPDEMNSYLTDGALLRIEDKDSISQLTSYGMVELGELEATFKKSDIADLKAFCSRQFDEYRLPYAHKAEKHKRRTSFCASVNTNQFLNDPTGSRRFIYIKLNEQIDMTGINVEQLWKQVYQLYINGERWWFEEGDRSTKIQRKVNSKATDSGLVGDAIGKVSKHERYSATKIWKFLMDSNPNKLERSQFYVDIEKLSKEKKYRKYAITVSKVHGISLPSNTF